MLMLFPFSFFSAFPCCSVHSGFRPPLNARFPDSAAAPQAQRAQAAATQEQRLAQQQAQQQATMQHQAAAAAAARRAQQEHEERAAEQAAAAAARQQRAAEAAAAARGLTAAAVAPGGSPCAVSSEYVRRCTGGFASRALGEGAFGKVMLGVDQGLGLRFAVKVLEQEVGGVPRAVQSAQREIQARGAL